MIGCLNFFHAFWPRHSGSFWQIWSVSLSSFHVSCHWGIVDQGYPICSMDLQVLIYSAVVHVMEGFLQFFNCPNEVTFIIRPHLPNVAFSPYKPSPFLQKKNLYPENEQRQYEWRSCRDMLTWLYSILIPFICCRSQKAETNKRHNK